MAQSTALAAVESNGAVVGAATYSPDQLAVLRKQLCKDLTTVETDFFLEVAKGLDLNPFTGEIFASVFGDGEKRKLVILPSELGHLKNAKRDPAWNGIEGPQWCGPDGAWLDFWPYLDIEDPPRFPIAARARAHRKGVDFESWAVVHFWGRAKTYSNGDLKDLWATDPIGMIGKCAVTAALKRAGFTSAPVDVEASLLDGRLVTDAAAEATAQIAPPKPMRQLTDGAGGPGHADLMATLTARLRDVRDSDGMKAIEDTWLASFDQPGGIRLNGSSHFALWKAYAKRMTALGWGDELWDKLRPTTDAPVPREQQAAADEAIEATFEDEEPAQEPAKKPKRPTAEQAINACLDALKLAHGGTEIADAAADLERTVALALEKHKLEPGCALAVEAERALIVAKERLEELDDDTDGAPSDAEE